MLHNSNCSHINHPIMNKMHYMLSILMHLSLYWGHMKYNQVDISHMMVMLLFYIFLIIINIKFIPCIIVSTITSNWWASLIACTWAISTSDLLTLHTWLWCPIISILTGSCSSSCWWSHINLGLTSNYRY